MNFARLYEWRGKLCLRLMEYCIALAERLRTQAIRDHAISTKPDDLLTRMRGSDGT